MEKEAYPSVPLFRYPFTTLSESDISAFLNTAAQTGPADSAGAPSFGKIQLVTDGGPSISYQIDSPERLTFNEAGSAPLSTTYGSMRLGHVTLLAHLVPGTMRGYLVVIDSDTKLATLIEFWFGEQSAKREVSRAIWFGYVADGSSAPEARHVATNRVEGKALYWKTESGFETIEYYVSAAYNHWVELTRLDGKRGYSAPADYIQLSEDLYLFTRTESEFSGIFTAYVMDLNRLEQIGMRIGFNGRDNLEFDMFRGTGEWLGQIAKFEEFGDKSGAPIPPPDDSKGSRRVYRPLQTMPRMSEAEVAKVAAESTHVFDRPSVMAGNGLPPSTALTGKRMILRYDSGPVMEYDFHAHDELKWRRAGQGNWVTARYNAWESMPGVFIFGHMLAGTEDHESHIATIDLESGMVTCFNGYLNTPYFANEAGARTLFGKIEAQGVPDPGSGRHGYTLDMIGRCLTWNYSPGLTSMHLYSTPYTTSWIIFTESGHGGMQWSGSGAHVKIRDGLYFVNWQEEACNGTLGTILINMRTMHDSGIGYHCGKEGLSLGPVGALARHAGKFDVDRFFEPRGPQDYAGA